MPFGTRGGIRVQHYFPYDGEYSLRAFLERNDLPKIEGVRFFQTKVEVKAGPHVVIATFPDDFAEREGPVPNVAGPEAPRWAGRWTRAGPRFTPLSSCASMTAVKLFEIAGMTVGEAAFAGTTGPPVMDRLEIRGPRIQGSQRNAQPAAHFRMPPGGSGRGARLRVENSFDHREARFSARCHCRESSHFSRSSNARGANTILKIP